MNAPSIHATRQQFKAAVESLQRAVTFQAWRAPDDGQNRTKGYGKTLPIEGPRYPAHPGESYGKRCTGKPCPAPGSPIDVSEAETLKEAIDKAAPSCWHKDHLMILEIDAGHATTRLHVYAIRQDSRAKYRGPLNTERYHELYAMHLFDLDVSEFAPCEPWKLTRDSTVADIIGIDPTLVEG